MPLNEPALDALIADAMPTTSLFDRYEIACKEAHAKYPKGDIPKDEKRALNAMYIEAVNETPGQLAVTLAANKDTPLSEADRELLYHKPAVTSDPGFDGRRKAA